MPKKRCWQPSIGIIEKLLERSNHDQHLPLTRKFVLSCVLINRITVLFKTCSSTAGNLDTMSAAFFFLFLSDKSHWLYSIILDIWDTSKSLLHESWRPSIQRMVGWILWALPETKEPVLFYWTFSRWNVVRRGGGGEHNTESYLILYSRRAGNAHVPRLVSVSEGQIHLGETGW